MTLAAVTRLLALASLTLLGAGLGLRAERGDAVYLFRHPWLLLRSLLAMHLIMPILAWCLVFALNLRPAVELALVMMSISPAAPFFPGKALKLTQRQGYIHGLLIASAVLAVVIVPLSTQVLSALLSTGGAVQVVSILKIVLLTILLPFALGAVVRQRMPARSERLARFCNPVGMVLLLVALVLLLIWQAAAMRALVGNGTLLAAVLYILAGLLVGHLLGGPDPSGRTVLALATATRHPAVALAAAAAFFPGETQAPAAVVLTLIVGMVATAPYTAWRRRHPGAGTPSEGSHLQQT